MNLWWGLLITFVVLFAVDWLVRRGEGERIVSANEKPGIGEIVHYVSRGSLDGKFPPTCRAAIVAERNYLMNDPGGRGGRRGWNVTVQVVNPQGIFFDEVDQDLTDGQVPGTWHWYHGDER